MHIKIDYSRDALLDDYAKTILRKGYMLPEEKSPQEAFARAAKAYADNEAHAQRLYDYASQLWFGFASPVLANAGNSRGLPISCFLQYVPDNRAGLTNHEAEVGWLSSLGGGCGAAWNDIRSSGQATSRGVTSSGLMPFLHVIDAKVLAYKQGEARRGAYAAYLDISHPEVIEFLEMRKPTGGDINRKNLNLHHALNIPDSFMQILERCETDPDADDSWALIDPHSGIVVERVSARMLWQRIIELRMETGEPYLHFTDASNRALPEAQKALNLKINNSNLCSEIFLPTNEERTAVCCLSSVNLLHLDKWANTNMIADLVRMLDNVLTVFINRAPDSIYKARYSAMQERSIGLGAMGFHDYLQSKMIPFESEEACQHNMEMFKTIRLCAESESRKLGLERGVAPDYIESNTDMNTWRRNMHLLAVAPTAKNSVICGNVSPGIEPHPANVFNQVSQESSNIKRNRLLDELLRSKGLNEETLTKIWKSISAKQGSCQHVKSLTEHEKKVFKTSHEIDQAWLVQHAADRQPYICQGQSLNLFFPEDVKVATIHKVHMDAWRKGLKSLYYCRVSIKNRSENIIDKVEQSGIIEKAKTPVFEQTQFKTKLPNGEEIECVGCSG